MSIFDLLKNILYSKEKISIDVDSESSVVPFMINRWLSFHSPDIANIINLTTNRFGSIFIEKNQFVAFLKNILPTKKFKIINYIKRKKDEAVEEDFRLGLLSKKLEISKREINEYILWLK